MFTRPLHYPGFDNAFVSFCPFVLVPVEKRIYLFTVLPWGWSVELKTLLCTDQPQEVKKHIYILLIVVMSH